jgi:hypothetical protein
MIELERQATYERLKELPEEVILAVQDSTTFNLTGRDIEGLGVLEDNKTQGFFAHTTLAVSTQGVPIGLLDQHVWSRPQNLSRQAEAHKKVPIEEKESYKWLKSLQESLKTESKRQLITICDREGDIFELFQFAQEEQVGFIVRGGRNRRIEDGGTLYKVLQETAVAQTFNLQIGRRASELPREVILSLRWATVTVRPPKNRPKGADFMPLTPQTLQVVETLEVNPPAGKPPIRWVLFTNLPVETPEQALQILQYYRFRWLIERFHFVLKSGLGMESTQLTRLNSVHNWLAVCSSVAWRLLEITYHTRIQPDRSAEDFFVTEEWQALTVFITKNPKIPDKPPSLAQMVRWIGELGGFLGRKSDGEPGVKVLWRGFIRLQDIVDTWRIFNP